MAVSNDSQLNPIFEILNSIDLGPVSDSVQFRFAKLQLAQAMLCKTQAEDYLEQIEQIQDLQKKTADMISEARGLQEEARKNNKSVEMPADMVKFCNDNNIKMHTEGNDTLHSKDEWTWNIERMTEFQNSISNKTSTLTVMLQDFIGQYNSMLQGANSSIKEANQVLQTIATNR